MMTLLAMMTMMTAYIRDITLHLHLLLHLHLHANLHLHCVTLHDKREHQPINQNKMQNFKYYIDQYSILKSAKFNAGSSQPRMLGEFRCLTRPKYRRSPVEREPGIVQGYTVNIFPFSDIWIFSFLVQKAMLSCEAQKRPKPAHKKCRVK